MSTTTKPKTKAADALMDRVVAFIGTNKGSANVRQILTECYNNKNPGEESINAIHRRLFEDGRFEVVGSGAGAVVSMAGQQTQDEPEELNSDTLDAQERAAGAAAEDRAEPEAEQASEAVAATSEPTAPADAKPAESKPTAIINLALVELAMGEILKEASAKGGLIAVADLNGKVAVKDQLIPDILFAMNEAGMIHAGSLSDNVVQLTATGWKTALERAQKLSALELAKKDDEIRAYRKHVAREKELADEVKICESAVEACKARTAAAKEELGAAYEKLAAFVGGDVQTTLFDSKPMPKPDNEPTGEVTAYEQGFRTFDPKKAEAINPYPADPQKSDWQRGYDTARGKADPAAKAPEDDAPLFESAPKAAVRNADDLGLEIDALDSALLHDGELDEMRRGTALAVADKTVRLYERDYLVIEAGGDDPDFTYLAVPLYDKDEWQQLHEGKHGRPVEGVDQNDEAKVQRQNGGEFCGRVVKLGRKKAVIGPNADAIAIVVKGDEETEENDEE